MKYQIRWATIDDAQEIADVHAKSWQAAYQDIIPSEVLEKMTSRNREERFKNDIEKQPQVHAVLVVNQKVIGFIALGESRAEDYSDSVGEIWAIYLLPSYWRQGLGTALLEWGIEELEKREYEKITLWVLEKNAESRRFYKKMGFVDEGTRREVKIGKILNKVRYKNLIK